MADKAEVTIMYLIFERFQTFVMSLNNINEMSNSINTSTELMAIIKSKNKSLKKELRIEYLQISTKVKVNMRRKKAVEYLDKINKIKKIFETIKELTDRSLFEESTQFYFEFLEDIKFFENCKIGKQFRKMEKVLTNNFLDFYSSNFERKLLSFFESSFFQPEVTFERFILSELDKTLANGLEMNPKTVFEIVEERGAEKSSQGLIVDLFMSLNKLTSITINAYKTLLVKKYEHCNRKIMADIQNFAENIKKKQGKLESFVELSSYYFEVHFFALRRILRIVKKIVVLIFEEKFKSVSNLDKLINSKEFAQVENLYELFLSLLRLFFRFFTEFFEGMKDHELSIAELINIELFVRKVGERIRKSIYENLFPKNKTDLINLELFRKMENNIRNTFPIEQMNKFSQEIVTLFFKNLQTRNLAILQKYLQEENWNEVYVSFEIKENLNQIWKKSSIALRFENLRVLISSKGFFISKSLSCLVGIISVYVKLAEKYQNHNLVARELAFDCLNFYNLKCYNLIIKGECLNHKILRRIDTLLMYAIVKELELISLLGAKIDFGVKNEDNSRRDFLENEVKKHKGSLLQNINSLLKYEADVIFRKVHDLKWQSEDFVFYTPSQSACDFISYVTLTVKSLKKFAGIEEYKSFLSFLKLQMIQGYFIILDKYSNISLKNAGNVQQEKKFLVENLEKFECGEKEFQRQNELE